jgi:transposase
MNRRCSQYKCMTVCPCGSEVARPHCASERGLLALGEPILSAGGRAVGDDSEVFVGLDVAKACHAVAVAEDGRRGEVRFLGEISTESTSVRRLVSRLEKRHARLHFCYEAGPTGYGLYRQLTEMGHRCTVVAPSMIPRKPGDRVKTNRRDAMQLARLLRAGELTEVWVPDEGHEAVRELIRSREAAVEVKYNLKVKKSRFHGRNCVYKVE